ncbi:MAG: hypothetical protein JNM90_23260 [Burkholderiales bacterium]|nr:hypothetical protein [Burkholderiales bacterium]
MRIGRQLFSLIVAALVCACAPELDWREVRVADGGFSVMFPKKPAQAERRLPTPAGEVVMRMYSARAGEHVLGAGYADFPAAVTPALLDAMRDALAANLGGAARNERRVDVAGFSAREFEASGTQGSGASARPVLLRARLLSRDRRYIQLVSLGSPDGLAAADIDLFLTSFKAE